MQFLNLKVPVFFLLSCMLCSLSLLGETTCMISRTLFGWESNTLNLILPLLWLQIWQSLKLISYCGSGFEATNYNCFGLEYRRRWLFQPLKTSNYMILGEIILLTQHKETFLAALYSFPLLLVCWLTVIWVHFCYRSRPEEQATVSTHPNPADLLRVTVMLWSWF